MALGFSGALTRPTEIVFGGSAAFIDVWVSEEYVHVF